MTAHPKIRKTVLFIAILAIAATIGIYLRLYTLFHHIPFESSERATLYVLSNLRKSITDSINAQHPGLTADQKNKLIKQRMDIILKTEGENIQRAIQKVSAEVGGDRSLLTKGPYLLASDGYYYYNLTENIIETGRISESIKGSKYFNPMMLSPFGYWEPLNLHPYVGALAYKIVQLFSPNIDLMFGVSFTPLFMTFLILIAFIYLGYMLNCRPLAILVASVLLACATIFLKRSMFAWYDADAYNIFFPLLILIFVLHGLNHRQKIRTRILFALLTAATFTLYALFWHGWMFLLITIIIGGLASVLYCRFILKQKAESKWLIQFFAALLGGALVGITFIFGLNDFFILFAEGWKALTEFTLPKLSPWPNLYIGVGELEKPSLPYLIDLIGGYFYFGVAVFGLIARGTQVFRKGNKESLLQFLVLSVLFLSTLFLGSSALRFALLAVMPTGIFCLIGLNILFNQLQHLIQKLFPSGKIGQVLALALLVLISASVITVASRQAYRKTPALLNKIFNSAWEKALIKIKQETPKESVINTWWPPGHFIKAVADRRVIFDGASINKPQGYWLANLFISDNEKQAAGILRMLNNSGNLAAEYLQENGFKLSDAVKVLKEIVDINAEKAAAILSPFLPRNKIERLLELTHAAPPPVYVLLYNDMIEKSIEYKFVGGWDFEKAEEVINNKEIMERLPPKNSPAFIQLLWKIAGGPYRFSGILGQLTLSGDTATFEHHVAVNLATKDVFVASPTYGKGVPQSIFYVENGNMVEKKLNNATLGYSVILTQLDGVYECVLLDSALAKSLLMRLYFLEGADLRYFRPFTQEMDLTRRTRIYVYEVDWPRFLADLSEGQ